MGGFISLNTAPVTDIVARDPHPAVRVSRPARRLP
jgi:hypothetical protein